MTKIAGLQPLPAHAQPGPPSAPRRSSAVVDALDRENGLKWTRVFEATPDDDGYDVIIVGSGMGGGVLGDATSEAGLRTLILEAGPVRHLVNVADLPVPNQLESVQTYDTAPDTDLRGGYCYNLGGRSVFWSAVIPRIAAWEREGWPHAIFDTKAGGIDYREAETTLHKRDRHPPFQQTLVDSLSSRLKAENAGRDDTFTVDHLPRSLHQPGSKYNRRPGSPDERATGTFSSAALIAESLINPGRSGSEFLDVAVEHVVERVVFEGGRAVGVEVLDVRNRRRRTIRGRRIVLAASTVESARLAHNSGIRHDLLGKGLSDHAEAEIAIVIPPNAEVFAVPTGLKRFTKDDQGNLFIRCEKPTTTRRFSCELALNWKYWDVRIGDDQIWRERYQDQKNDQRIHGTIKFLFANPLDEGNQLAFDGDDVVVSVGPSAVKEVEAARSEAEELAKVVVDWLGAKRVDPVTGETIDLKPLVPRTYSETHHLAGSLRMGEDTQHGVVDTDLAFHGYENLYCCDLSVFPAVPAANPSLTLAALAARLARHLTERVHAEQAEKLAVTNGSAVSSRRTATV